MEARASTATSAIEMMVMISENMWEFLRWELPSNHSAAVKQVAYIESRTPVLQNRKTNLYSFLFAMLRAHLTDHLPPTGSAFEVTPDFGLEAPVGFISSRPVALYKVMLSPGSPGQPSELPMQKFLTAILQAETAKVALSSKSLGDFEELPSRTSALSSKKADTSPLVTTARNPISESVEAQLRASTKAGGGGS
jgi:hypothetical protein